MTKVPKKDITLIEIVKGFAIRENCIAGLCDATPLTHHDEGFTPFVSRNPLKRTDPAANLPGAKSIIVVGVESKFDTFPPMPEGAGILSAMGAVQDYHVVIKALLKRLADELQQHTNFTCKILVDSPNLDERAVAVRAGMGFLGRNGLVISPEYGSRFNIGLLLTDIPFTNYEQASCVNHARPGFKCSPKCRRCINACPTGALSYPEGYDVTRCISYLTQKDDLTQEEAALMGRHLYGCDVCQNACPFNRPQPQAWAMPEGWLSMSDAEFAKTYGHTTILWRGTALLRRNAKAMISM